MRLASLSPPVAPQTEFWKALLQAARSLEAVATAALGNSSAPNSSALVTTTSSVATPSMLDDSADDPRSLVDTVNAFLLAKARNGRSDRYLRQLRVVMMHFCAGRARRPITSITVGEIERWLGDGEWAARTQRGYLSDVRTLFNFAERRGLVSRSPAAGVELPRTEDFKPPKIHTPLQVQQVLDAARDRDPDVCRHMAVRYFAGVRSSEAHRLTEENIMLDRGVIEVPAAKSKTRRRRLVEIQPNLRAWLELGGEMRPMSDYRTIRPVLRASKVEWFQNVTRHSFVSYHLAQFQNAGKTALQAGHTEQMVFQHYRELVMPADAAAFWSIVPK